VDEAGNTSALSYETTGTTTGDSFLPLIPQNVNIEISGSNVLLSWDPVTHDTEGNEITISSYRIYWNEDPYFTPDVFEAEVTESSFEHVNGTLAGTIFYRITAVKDVAAAANIEEVLRNKQTTKKQRK
jgi:glucan biosynthesis protein